MPGNIDLTYRVLGADAVASSLQQVENQARNMSSSMVSTTGNARSAVRALSSALAATETIARLTGDSHREFANKLSEVTIAVASASFAVQSLRGITLSYAAAVTFLSRALTGLEVAVTAAVGVLTAPFAIVVAAVAVLYAGLLLLDQKFKETHDAAAEAQAEFEVFGETAGETEKRLAEAAKAAEAMARATREVHATNLILAGSLEQVSLSFKDYGAHLKTAGAALVVFRQTTQEMEVQAATDAVNQWGARQEALAGGIERTTVRLGALISAKQQTIDKLKALASNTELTTAQQRAYAQEIANEENALIGLNTQLVQQARNLRDANIAAIVQGTIWERNEAIAKGTARTARLVQEWNEQEARLNELLARTRDEATQNAAAFDRWLTEANQLAETGLAGELENWINAANAFGLTIDANVTAGLRRSAAAALAVKDGFAVMRQALQNFLDVEDATAGALKGESDALAENRDALDARVAALDRELSLITDRPKQLAREQAGLRELIIAYREQIAQIKEAISARIAEGGQTDALTAALDALERVLAALEHRAAQTGNAIRDGMLQPLRDLAQRSRTALSRPSGTSCFGPGTSPTSCNPFWK
jgi:chromosome segregation ATPase